MSTPTFPPIPLAVKHVAHYMKIAEEHDSRNILISYWSRMYVCDSAMKSIVGKKPPEVTAFLLSIMAWLEETKKEHADVDGIMNATVGQAMLEEYILKIFNYADSQDKLENFGKNVVKAFYTAGVLMDMLQQFGTLSDEMFNKRQYAKWKAAYIHHCLKIGEDPLPGPRIDINTLEFSDEDEVDDDDTESNLANNPSADRPNELKDDGSTDNASNYVPPAPLEPQPNPPKPLPVPAPRSSSASPKSVFTISPEDIEKAQKLCKWAGSALTYDDINTAVDNLQQALALLQAGKQD